MHTVYHYIGYKDSRSLEMDLKFSSVQAMTSQAITHPRAGTMLAHVCHHIQS